MTLLADDGAAGTRVARLREGRVELLGTLPSGFPPTVLGPGLPVRRPVLPGLVLDVGKTGARIRRDGRVVAALPVGGLALDAAVGPLLRGRPPAEVTALREVLSWAAEAEVGGVVVTSAALRAVLAPLLGHVVAMVGEVVGPGVPLRVVGGVARTPLLVELLEAAGIGPVTVPRKPEVAVLVEGMVDEPGSRPVEVTRPLLSSPPRPSWWRRTALATAAVAGAAALLALGTLIPTPLPAARLVLHGYELALPAGWEHAGGDPVHRRTLLTPRGLPDATGLVVVERTPLGYDAGAEPERAQAELRARYAEAGPRVTGLHAEGEWVRYREGAVDWWVRFAGPDQLGVGCRYPPGGSAAVDAACAVVRDSLRTL